MFNVVRMCANLPELVHTSQQTRTQRVSECAEMSGGGAFREGFDAGQVRLARRIYFPQRLAVRAALSGFSSNGRQ